MIKRLALATTLLLLCLFAAPKVASAFDPFPNVCNGGGGSAVCQDKNVGSNDPLVEKMRAITNIVAYAGGAAAIVVILVSAIKFITSGSDVSTGARTDTDVENARRALGNAAIGLAVIILGRTLILYVLSKV